MGLVAGAHGLLRFIVWVGRRTIESRKDLPSGQVRVTLSDGTTIEIPTTVLTLYDSLHIRATAAQVVAPLQREGVSEVQFRTDDGVPMLLIDEGDLPAFDVGEIADEPLSDDIETTHVSIATAAFIEGNKWRVSSDDQTFYAGMDDPAFLESVNQGEKFAKGDVLKVRMRVIQSRGPSGLQTQRSIVEVLDHIPRERQLRLSPEDAD